MAKITKKAKVTKKAKTAKTAKTAVKGSDRVGAVSAAAGTTSEGLVLGRRVPEFSLPATGGKRVRLSDLKGQWVVLYFYPKDSTPGCTVEGHDFSRLQGEFSRLKAQVFGVSRDSLSSHERFKEKEGYSIDLLSDQDEKLCEMFAVIKMKNMYGRQVRGIERSTFIIDPDGRLNHEWRKVSVPGHAEAVLKHLKDKLSMG